MKKILEILDTLATLRGKEKEQYLVDQLDNNPPFVKVVQLALDSSRTFGVSAVKKAATHYDGGDVLKLLSEMTKIKGNATKDQKEHLAMVASQDVETFEVTNRILSGKLKCGIGATKIHDLRPGLVPYFPYQRCNGVGDLDKFKTGDFFFSQMKANGLYDDIIVNLETKTVTYRTRNGNVLHLQLGVEEKLLALAGGSCVLMGELTLLDPTGMFTMPRAAGNAIITQAIHGRLPAEVEARIRVHLWDCVPLADHEAGSCSRVYKDRLQDVRDFLGGGEFGQILTEIETRTCYSMDDAWAHYSEIRGRHVLPGEDQLEGTVIKQADGGWIDSGSAGVSWQVKLKAEKEAELVVTGWKPGKVGTKYEGMIGSLLLESSCGKIKTYCSGMGDSVRARDPEELMGQIVSVCFNAISKNFALDHPRVVDMRPDKSTADAYEYIKNVKSVRKK